MKTYLEVCRPGVVWRVHSVIKDSGSLSSFPAVLSMFLLLLDSWTLSLQTSVPFSLSGTIIIYIYMWNIFTMSHMFVMFFFMFSILYFLNNISLNMSFWPMFWLTTFTVRSNLLLKPSAEFLISILFLNSRISL